MTKKRIKSPSSLLDVEDIFDVSILPSLSKGGSEQPKKEKAEVKPSYDLTLSFEQRIIKDLVHAQTYIRQNNLEDDFKTFRDKYFKKKL